MTRWLHAAIAFGVTAQLALSLVMEAPDDKDGELVSGLPLQLYEIHEKIGLALVLLLVLHWLWSLSGHVHGGVGHLFPWFSKERLEKVRNEIRNLLNYKLSNPETSNELAGAVHGLGLLAATVMAATGTVIFFNLSATGHMTDLGENFHNIHGFFAPFMWAYLIGHVIAAGIHKRMGHMNVQQIFSLLKR